MEIVEDIDQDRHIDAFESRLEPGLEVATGDREVNQGVPTDPGQLSERSIQIRHRQVLEHVRSDRDVELKVAEHVHVVDATEDVRLECSIDVERYDLVSPPLEDFRRQPLARSDYQNAPAVGEIVHVTILIVSVDEIREIELAQPLLAIDRHD